MYNDLHAADGDECFEVLVQQMVDRLVAWGSFDKFYFYFFILFCLCIFIFILFEDCHVLARFSSPVVGLL